MKISQLLETFASPNSFEVTFSNGALFNAEASVYCKAVSLPDRELKTVDFFYDGVKYPLAREVSFKNTTEMTFYMNDSGNREAFIKWVEMGRRLRNNVSISDNVPKNSGFYMDGRIIHKGGMDNHETAAVYTFHHLFPTEVGAVALSHDGSTIPEFTVTFAYSTFDTKITPPHRIGEARGSTKGPIDHRGLTGIIDDFIASF